MHEPGFLAATARVLSLGVLLSVFASACGGSGNSAHPSSNGATTLRPLAICLSDVHIPLAVSVVMPSAALPPTAVLRPGAAVAFSAPAGSTIGLSGPVDASERGVVCRAPLGGQRDRVVLVAQHPGYVRVAVRTTAADIARLTLVKVTS